MRPPSDSAAPDAASLLADPWIAAKVEAALAPYAGRLSADDLGWMRAQLAEVLAGDERAAKLLRRARPASVDRSGTVPTQAQANPVRARRRGKVG